MSVANEILESRKNSIWLRYQKLRNKQFPFEVPDYLLEALQAAYHRGLQEGYGEGLVDGVNLGLDVSANLERSEKTLS
jgi:hypothetical protein